MDRRHASSALALVIAAGALLGACGDDSVPDAPNEATVSVGVKPDASGVVLVALGGTPDDDSITAMADGIDPRVFPGREADGVVKGGAGDTPLLEFTTTGVFDFGDAPTLEVDTRHLCDELAAAGFSALDVRLALPDVDADRAIVPESTSGGVWHVGSCNESPHGTVTMRPNPANFWRALLLLIVVVVANVTLAAIGRRGLTTRRWTMPALSGVAVVACLGVIATAGARAGDEMEVAGRISHGANVAFFLVAVVVIVFGLIAAVAQPWYWRQPPDQRPRLRRRRPAPSAPGAPT